MSAPSSRLSDVRAHMVQEGIDLFLVPRADEFQGEYVPAGAERLSWLTGFTGSAGMAAVGTDKAVVVTDSRYELQVVDQTDAAIGVLAALAPIIMGILRARTAKPATPNESRPPRSQDLTRAEALDILGLSGEPEEKDIQDAYRRLMKSMHPDQKGSPWVAERLNAARDRLLKKKP